MAATPGLPSNFLAALKQKASSEEGVVCFLDELEPNWICKTPVKLVLKDLQALPSPYHRVLELVVSYGFWAEWITDWLNRSLSSVPWPSMVEGTHTSLLQRFVDFVYFEIAPDTNAAAISKHSAFEDRLLVERLLTALQECVKLSKTQSIGDGMKHGLRKKGAGVTAAERKRRPGQDEMTANTAFQQLGLPKPTSLADVEATGLQLTGKLQDLLVKYIRILQSPNAAREIRTLIVQAFSIVPSQPNPGGVNTVSKTQVPALHAFDRPLKASLYFDSAVGFGQWQILVSNRAIREIRKICKESRKLYQIYVRKMRELSNAHFPSENHRRLDKGEGVAIYSAKLDSQTRLVYQIDCIREYDSTSKARFECQIIRVFGVYKQDLAGRLWDSLAFHLAQRGEEYVRRCSVRKRSPENSMLVPAIFPINEDIQVFGGSGTEIPREATHDMRKEELEEIHSLLVIDKFVMFSKELNNSILADLEILPVPELHPDEMEIIEHPYSCYVIGRSGTGKTTTMLVKMLGLERTFSTQLTSDMPKPRQLFVTKSRILASKVEEYFMRLMASLQAATKTERELEELSAQQQVHAPSHTDEMILYNRDDDVRWKSDLPEAFSQLQEDHFPLFVTFDKLADLIGADLGIPHHSEAILTYLMFLDQYWPHFPRHLTKDLDPALVFSEIIGVIKGSKQAFNHEDRYLDRDAYLSLSERKQFLLSSQRESVYALFLKYQQRKRELGHRDTADRTHQILRTFSPDSRVDFLYVDEAQDNMLIDAKLLRMLCKNSNGLFWAGDTAQTISAGSSFRFDELKAFLYELEESEVARVAIDIPVAPKPATFMLSINHRSHEGIVSCARSIIDIITHFWPSSLDKLAPEKAKSNGPKPLFLGTVEESSTMQFQGFLAGGKPVQNIQFGAEQCILVRDDNAKQELRKILPRTCIIMTIYDAKGLEFDDVLLYQFFRDSTVDFGRWRLLANLIPGETAPQFDGVRHASLCNELKFLYVAVTRARSKLWIYDNSIAAGPLKILWATQGLVKTLELGSTTQLPGFAVAAPGEQWKEKGRYLFDREKYAEAVICFEVAELPRQARIATAHQLRQEAQNMAPQGGRRNRFALAAQAFEKVSDESEDPTERRVFGHNSGHCFKHAKDTVNAARMYLFAEAYDDCLELYWKAGMFDEGIELLKDREHQMEKTKLIEGFKDDARLFYFVREKLRKGASLFRSIDEAISYLNARPFLNKSLAKLFKKLGRKWDAAQVHLGNGRPLDAIQLLLEDNENAQSTRLCEETILKCLWRLLPFGTTTKPGDESHIQVQVLLDYTARLSAVSFKNQFEMFQAIQQSQWSKLRAQGKQFFARGEKAPALLCFSHYFSTTNFPKTDAMDNIALAQFLEEFWRYCKFTLSFTNDADLDACQLLFNFEIKAANTCIIQTGTWLHKQLRHEGGKAKGAVQKSLPTLLQHLSHCLLRCIATTIRQEASQICSAAAFSPCIHFIALGWCKDDCHTPHHHLRRADLTRRWMTAQARIHLQQILICQLLESIPPKLGGGKVNRRFWINRLYHTLNPVGHQLGSYWTISAIPEAVKSSAIVKAWCRDVLNGGRESFRRLELSAVLQAADLCFHLDRTEAGTYVHRSTLIIRELWVDAFFDATQGEKPVFTLSQALTCLHASRPRFVADGVAFARHVLKGNLFIDINIFCNFLDFLCGATVLACHGFRWHNLTLPRSLLLTLLQRTQNIPECDTSVLESLLEVLGELLKILVNGGEEIRYLLYAGSDLRTRALFIPRVCIALSLVGYNVQDPKARQAILGWLKLLKTIHPTRAFRQFAQASSWKNVASALQSSYRNSTLDDLVNLWSSEHRPPPKKPPSGVTRVVFNSPHDLKGLLRNAGGPVITHKGVQLSSNVLEPSSEIRERGFHAEPSAVKDTTPQDLPAVRPAVLEPSPEAFLASPQAESPTAIVISPELLAAGQTLKKAYERLLRNRQCDARRSPQEAACYEFFKSCLEETGRMEWPAESPYKKHYLGVVLHLLVCLQWVQNYVLEEQEAANEAFDGSAMKLKDIKKAGERIVALFELSEKVTRLHSVLEPRSSFHARRDLKELRRVIDDVEALFMPLPPSLLDEVRFNLDLVLRVQRKGNQSKKVKPELNMGDEMEDYDDAA